MTIFNTKSVILNQFSTPKAAGKATDSKSANFDPENVLSEGVRDYFQNMGDIVGNNNNNNSSTVSSNPLGDLRSALDNGSVAMGEVDIPSVEELVEKFPTLNEIASGEATKLYENFKVMMIGRHTELDDLRERGTISASEMKELASLDRAIIKVDEEIGKVRALAKQARETYKQEIELLQQVGRGEIEAVEADLNGDGKIGNPHTTEYVLGTRTIDGEKEITVLVKETMKPLKFDKNGFPLSGNAMNPNYVWDLSSSGLKVLNIEQPNDPRVKKADIVMQGSPALLAPRETYEGSGRTYQSNIDIPVPEFIWVKTYADGSPRIVDKKYDVYLPANGSLQFSAPPEKDRDKYMQVKVTDVGVSSIKNQQPLNWNESGGKWNASANDGFDQLITMKDASGNTIMSTRITGAATSDANLTNLGSDYMAASSMALTFNGGKGDNTRTSSVHISAGSNFVSTGNLLTFTATVEHQENATDTLDRFSTGRTYRYIGSSSFAREETTGIGVFGVHGVIEGTNFSDVYDLPPFDDDVSQTDPNYASVVQGNGGFNAVFARGGHNSVTGMTLVDIEGKNGDRNFVGVTNVVAWKERNIGTYIYENIINQVQVLLSEIQEGVSKNKKEENKDKIEKLFLTLKKTLFNQKQLSYDDKKKVVKNLIDDGLVTFPPGTDLDEVRSKIMNMSNLSFIQHPEFDKAFNIFSSLAAAHVMDSGDILGEIKFYSNKEIEEYAQMKHSEHTNLEILSTVTEKLLSVLEGRAKADQHGINPKVYIKVSTPGIDSQTSIDNPTEPSNSRYINETNTGLAKDMDKYPDATMNDAGPVGEDGAEDGYVDDVYHDDYFELIDSGTVKFTNPSDSDLPIDFNINFTLTDESTGGVDELGFGDNVKNNYTDLLKEIHSDPKDEDAGELLEEETWIEYGPTYTNAVTTMDSFFSAFEASTGYQVPGYEKKEDDIDAIFAEADRELNV